MDSSYREGGNKLKGWWESAGGGIHMAVVEIV